MNKDVVYWLLLKRSFDFFMSVILLITLSWLIFFAWFFSSINTRENGFFLQQRVGKDGVLFYIIKIRTMNSHSLQKTTVTTSKDPRITNLGKFLRRTKIDELPQLWNVFTGDMSFVGPRPDVPGYADKLQEDVRKELLSVYPGITGPATLAYRNEETLLSQQEDPEFYNDNVIYPDKVQINLNYIRNWRFRDDLKFIFQTIIG
jgi:lipopolysaccharide/colanic/teichoic acid biosynthesis glycosyltransferase